MSGAPLFVAAAQGTPLDHLDHLALMASRACVPRSKGLINRQLLIVYHPQGTCTDSRLKHSPSISVKEAYMFVWSFPLRGRLLV